MVFGTWERYLVAVIAEDTVPPVIHLPSKNYYVGDSIAYMKGLKVWDNADTDVEVTVDPGDLDPHKAGIYPVVYTATDDELYGIAYKFSLLSNSLSSFNSTPKSSSNLSLLCLI